MIATYRLQVHPEFGFDAVEGLIPYLQRLGVSHLYLSPITEAAGSSHGYDVVNHNAVRELLGGREGFERLLTAARQHGLEVIIDFVPNHAGVGPTNAYWQDVLAYGPHSTYGPYFDIDWNPIKPELHNKILLPFLGKTYGEAIDGGEITLAYEDGYVSAVYYENRFRLNPPSYTVILREAMARAERTEPYWAFKDLLEAYETLEPHERDKAEALRFRLIGLFKKIDASEVLSEFKGDRLHELLEGQFWRLSFWKTVGSEVNYRRFFDINELVALRMEGDQVFWDAHQMLSELLALDGVAGVRIDHVDGLFDPHAYLNRLQNLGTGKIWVEKILAHGETLPEDWPVAGTTGYEFMNDVMGVLLKRSGRIPLEKAYRRTVGRLRSFRDEVYAGKKLVIRSSLSSELFRLAYELDRISEADYHTRDFTLEAIRLALGEIVAVFHRYRTYLPYDAETARDVVREAVYRARSRNPIAEPTVFDFISQIILGDVRDDLKEAQRAWVGRFQQYTAPIAAKGVEDTAFYRYLVLIALNEVGGEPDLFGQSLQAFHSRARFRQHRYPSTLLTTATHDHKRGEDTRMRLITLAEMPALWEETARTLMDIGTEYASDAGPSKSDQYLFLQTLVALWHHSDKAALGDRMWQYMQKASRESKRQTSWTNPDEAYEQALEQYVRGFFEDERLNDSMSRLAALVAKFGFFNSLSQTLLKFTTPGVPDIYQGGELLDLSLVDPDNRRPVDFELRVRLLDDLQDLLESPEADIISAMIHAGDARAKMYFTARLLRIRKVEFEVFKGDYRPMDVEGSDHWIVFARESVDRFIIVCVPRYPATWPDRRRGTVPLPPEWADRKWGEVLSGTEIKLGRELRLLELPLPWGVLVS